MKNLKVYFILILSVLPLSCWAGGPGTTGADILAVEMGARPLGMAGAFTAVADDANAVSYNPAGLTQLKRPMATGTHWLELDGTFLDFLSYATPFFKGSGVAASLVYRQIPPIANVDPSLESTINASDLVLSGSWASRLDEYYPGLSGGVTFKIIYSNLDIQSAFDAAVDVGLLLQDLPFNAKAALVLQNIGPPIKFISQGDLLPFSLNLAASSQLAKDAQKAFQVSGDLYQPIDNLLKLRLGAEFVYLNFLSLRAGYALDLGGSTRGVSLGMGISYTWERTLYSLDYGYEPFYFKNSNTPTHLISLSAQF